MASTSLQLATPKKEKSSIICQLTDGRNIRIKITSGLSVKTKHWSKVNSKVMSADPDAIAKNKSLADLKRNMLDIYLSAKSSMQSVDASYVREQLKPKVNIKTTENPDNVIAQLQLYLTANTNKSYDFIRTAKPVIRHLSHFLKLNGYNILKFKDLNKPFLESYEYYLGNENHEYIWEGKNVIKKPLKSGTINTHFTHLKLLCQNLMGEVQINNAIFQHKVTEINAKSRALNWEELKAIMAIKTTTQTEKLSKDIFLFSCFTGLRISKIQQLQPGDIQNGFIHWLNAKGRKVRTVQTTVHLYNYDIITRYKSPNAQKVFPVISQQTINLIIKDLCRNADIENPKEIHCHTGRHSYNTLLSTLGIDVFVRNEELGHAHGNINQEVYTKLDENERKTLIVDTFDNAEKILANKKSTTSRFDHI